jgi:hypothetical protein
MSPVSTLRLLPALLTASVACAAVAMDRAVDKPLFIVDSQYTAALHQRAHRWQLRPYSGEVVDVTDVSAKCGSDAAIPTGLWYITQDADGKLQMIAPSVTELPGNFPQQVALRACGDEADTGVTLFVPAIAMNWIRTNVGAVLVDE